MDGPGSSENSAGSNVNTNITELLFSEIYLAALKLACLFITYIHKN